jgi:hypothetical protein
MKKSKLLSALIATVLLFVFSMNDANGQQLKKWVDHSDELPGMVSDGEMLLIAGGAVVLIGGLVAYLIIKKKQDKKLESTITDFSNYDSFGQISGNNPDESGLFSFANEIYSTSQRTPVLIYTRLNPIQSQDYTTKQVFTIGVRFSF